MASWAEIMRGIPDDTLREASAVFNTLDFRAGDVLMAEGVDDPVMLYVMSGAVEILRNGRPIDAGGPGDILGAMEMVRQRPRISEVRSTETTRGLVLGLEAYRGLVEAENPVIYRLEHIAVTQLASRLRKLNSLVRERSEGERDRYARPTKGFFAALRSLVGDPALDATPRAMKPADVLSKSPLFEGERPETIEELTTVWDHAVFRTGESLCEQGDEANGLYLLGHGNADVYVALGGQKIHKLGSVKPGDAVGMTAMLDGKPRGATVIATEQVDALCLPRTRFVELIAQDTARASALRRAVIRGFADQVLEAGQSVVSVTPVVARPDMDDVRGPN